MFVFVILINFLFRHVLAGMTDQGVNAINHLEHEWAEIVMLLVVNAVAMGLAPSGHAAKGSILLWRRQPGTDQQ